MEKSELISMERQMFERQLNIAFCAAVKCEKHAWACNVEPERLQYLKMAELHFDEALALDRKLKELDAIK
jgi:hypothetical protein